jgi:hypothetical protein
MPESPFDAERIPVVIASGQALERDVLVNPVDLMMRAATAVEVAELLEAPETATVEAATVSRDNDETAARDPVVARLADGVTAAMGDLDVPGLVGGAAVVQAGEPRYRLAER